MSSEGSYEINESERMAIRILVVDDASFIRDMVKKQLRDGVPGAQVLEAPDGNRALAVLKQQTVDLVLSDWEMPNMSGEELLRELRSQPGQAQLPFVMVTSRGDRGHVVKAIEAGASDYLVKPFTPEELLRKVAKQLARAGKTPAAQTRASTSSMASDTLSVLTGGRNQAAGVEKGRNKKSLGVAQLRLGSRAAPLRCVLRDLSLQALTGLVQRTEPLPSVFDPVVVDIEADGADVDPVCLNGYIHSVQAAENKPDTKVIRLVVCFVDQDEDKVQALSRYISRM